MITDTHKEREEAPAGLLSSDRDEGTNLLDLFIPLAERRTLIAKVTAAAALASVIVSLLISNKYTAVAKILPPQQSQSSLSSMLGQLGALSGLSSAKDNLLGLKNPADLYVGILRSRTIADSLIEQFDLKTLYRDKNLSAARKDLESHSTIESTKDGMISVAFEDKDPNRAAAIANAYVAHLYQANQRLAISEAAQRRLFYEKQLEDEKNTLTGAEVELKKTQERTGLIQLNSQADAIIRSSALLKAQITAKEVQLQGLRSFSTEQNPALIRVEQELAALKSQMAKLEKDQHIGGGNIQIPTGKVPEVGLEYARRYRDVKYHEVLFEILAKQYEAAKLDEGKNAPIIQVVDSAVPPDKKSGPPRTLIVMLSTLLGFFVSCCYVWVSAGIQSMKADPEQRMKLEFLQNAFRRHRAF
jgi:tyrosine-protein kinase Etk/Wzc